MKSTEAAKYVNIFMGKFARRLLEKHPAWFHRHSNGVGSKVGFWRTVLYYLTPDTIWFLSIKKEAKVHDVEYVFPRRFATMEKAIAWKNKVDQRFYNNIEAKILEHGGWLESARLHRAKFYFEMVQTRGKKSFLERKIINGKKY